MLPRLAPAHFNRPRLTPIPAVPVTDSGFKTMAPTSRRALLLAGAGACLPRPAFAGAQVEEPLADAVRSALSAAIASDAPPKPHFDSIEPRLAYLRWLGEMSERMKRKKSETQTRIEFLETVWYESARAGLETALVLGLVQVESGFKKYAISVAGARGTLTGSWGL